MAIYSTYSTPKRERERTITSWTPVYHGEHIISLPFWDYYSIFLGVNATGTHDIFGAHHDECNRLKMRHTGIPMKMTVLTRPMIDQKIDIGADPILRQSSMIVWIWIFAVHAWYINFLPTIRRFLGYIWLHGELGVLGCYCFG